MMRNLTYEWRRISSIRSTWILTGVTIVAAAALAELIAVVAAYAVSHPTGPAGPDGGPVEVATKLSLGEFVTTAMTNPLSIAIVFVILSTIVAQAFGQEYRHGTIRLTLTAFPRRVPVFVAKAIVCLAVVVVTFVITVLLTIVIGLLNSGAVGGDAPSVDFFGPAGRMILYLIGYCLIVFAVTVITRVLALGVIIPLLFLIVVEAVLVNLVSRFVHWLPEVMPFTSALAFVNGTDMVRNGLVFLAWIVVLVGIALAVFRARDA